VFASLKSALLARDALRSSRACRRIGSELSLVVERTRGALSVWMVDGGSGKFLVPTKFSKLNITSFM
jgi:hypothetical protein